MVDKNALMLKHIENFLPLEESKDLFSLLWGLKKSVVLNLDINDSASEKYLHQMLLDFSDKLEILNKIGSNTDYNKTQIYIADSKENLMILEAAESIYETGKALDYPHDAIEAFASALKDDKTHCNFGTYFDCLVDAHKNGQDIPLWFAYLTHMPSQFNPVKEEYSSSSRLQAMQLQKLMKKEVPEIADYLEFELLTKIDSITKDKFKLILA